jgi:hypothetical protein
MNTLVHTPLLGLEDIQRQAVYVLMGELNTVLVEVQGAFADSDRDFAAKMNRPYEPTTLEMVEDQNFHEGHTPSLINSDIDGYPNVSVMAYRAAPSPADAQYDHQTIYLDQLVIDTMVKSITSEEEVNRRARRMTEAVNICLMRNQTLNGIVQGFDSSPTIRISDVFTRKERTSYGPEWFWQGSRLEYAVRKEAVHASLAGLNIDQA